MAAVIEWFGVAFVALLFVAALVQIARRFHLTRRLHAFDCARLTRARRGPQWSIGYARFGDDRFEWFSAFALGLVPRIAVTRKEILTITREVVNEPAENTLIPGAVRVGIDIQARPRLDLLMSRSAYYGLASWTEASPPSRRENSDETS